MISVDGLIKLKPRSLNDIEEIDFGSRRLHLLKLRRGNVIDTIR